MDSFRFSVSKEIKTLGIPVMGLYIAGISNTNYGDFEAYKDGELSKLKTSVSADQINNDNIIQGFRVLHEKVGRSNRKYISSPESLWNFFLSRGRLPKINPVVDIYNLVSLQSKLALGAHDVSKITGNITLRFTHGDESFVPLGKTEPEPIQPGEYAYVDDGYNIICRLEVLQCNQTKITSETTDIFLIIQGNPYTDTTYVQETAEQVGKLIQHYCGGVMDMMQPTKREDVS